MSLMVLMSAIIMSRYVGWWKSYCHRMLFMSFSEIAIFPNFAILICLKVGPGSILRGPLENATSEAV